MSTTTKSLLLFWRANWQHRNLFLSTIFSWVTGMILQKLVLPIIIAQAINKLIATPAGADYTNIFAPYLITFFVIMLCAQALIDSGLYFLSKLETKVRPELQMRVFDMILNQSLNFHANNFSGALVNQCSKFTSAYIGLTDSFLLSMTITAVIAIGSIAVLTYYLPIMGLAMAIWTVLFVALNIKLTRRRMKFSRIATEADSLLTAHLSDVIGNISAVKSFGRESAERKEHSVKNLDRATKKYKSWTTQVTNDVIFGLLISGVQFLILALSILFVAQGKIDVGVILLSQVYITQLIGQLWGLSSLSRTVEQCISDAAEMTELLDEETLVTDPKNPKKVAIKKGKIEFKNVNFTHTGNTEPLFSNFNLTVKPGQKVGLVGHSGSGKTSLTRLLLRFVDIDSGEICIDSQDIRSVRQADLRSHIAYVPQEPVLFHRSLLENIAYGKLDASEEQIKKAAKMAHTNEFIESLPQGYNTMVGERGIKLSGGQRQRVAIARAILKDAPILVLDEATSALDSESEQLIQSALWELMQNRTTIVIAHRLSTIQRMDKIVVLEDGKITEEGSHAELLKRGTIYSDLWKRQSGGFIEE